VRERAPLSRGGPRRRRRAGAWTRTAYAACRNTVKNVGQIGCGNQLATLVGAGEWWRVTFQVAKGYKAPDYVYDGTGAFTVTPFG
jgi:hypothetical protein